MTTEEINELSNIVIGLAIKIHKSLGPGFIEKIYAKALAQELKDNKIVFEREKTIRVTYNNILLGYHRIDLLVKKELIIEIKAVYDINNFHMAQILSYLKVTNKRLGLILNFARAKLQVKRVVFNL